MACMGPSYSKEKADKAFRETFKFLQDRYDLMKFATDAHPVWGKHRKRVKARLKAVVHAIFEQDCFETF